MRSIPALARLAERHVSQRGPVEADELLDVVMLAAAGIDRERAEAGVRLAVIGRRLVLDRNGTLRTPPQHPRAPSKSPDARQPQ